MPGISRISRDIPQDDAGLSIDLKKIGWTSIAVLNIGRGKSGPVRISLGFGDATDSKSRGPIRRERWRSIGPFPALLGRRRSPQTFLPRPIIL